MNFIQSVKHFTKDLDDVYGDGNSGVRNYTTLVNKVSENQLLVVAKHKNLFKKFFKDNTQAILTKNVEQFVNPTLRYSSRVSFNVADIIKQSDKDTSNAIWNHLLVISASLNTQDRQQLLNATLHNTAKKPQLPSELPDISNLMGMLQNMNVQGGGENPMSSIGMNPAMLMSMAPMISSVMTNINNSDGPPDIKSILKNVLSSMGIDDIDTDTITQDIDTITQSFANLIRTDAKTKQAILNIISAFSPQFSETDLEKMLSNIPSINNLSSK